MTSSTNTITNGPRVQKLIGAVTRIMLGDAPEGRLKDAFAAIAHELDARYYFHYRTDDYEPDALILESAGGFDDALQRLRFGESLSGRIAVSRTPLILDNVDARNDDMTANARALGIRCYLGLPLLAHGELFGAVGFASTTQAAFADADVELVSTLVDQLAVTLERTRLVRRLRDSEARYRGAVITGRLAAWETDMVTRTRIWTQEGMDLFGLDLPNGRGQVGGDNDEFKLSLHPDDRYMVAEFHKTAETEDFYPAEYRIVKPDGTMLWVSGRGRVITRGPDGRAQRVANIVVDVTDRKKSEEHIKLLMREISHRSKNLLAVVRAIAGQTARTAATKEEFVSTFAQRLQGLAASHDLLVEESWRGAPLSDLVRQQLSPFAEADSLRLELNGPSVALTTEAAQAIGLALHELATNAIKYGAWSLPEGTVSVSWAFDKRAAGVQHLRLNWLERGGPPVVTPPARKGFGHVVIESMVAQSVDGEVSMSFDPDGLSWELSIPISNLVSGAPLWHHPPA